MSAELNDVGEKQFRYLFFAGVSMFPDPFAGVFPTHREWGKLLSEEELFAGVSPEDPFDWGEDARPRIPREKSILYGLHVRGFTRGVSSGAAHKGTFLGVTEKLPYLKELGVNGLVLMPVYTFLEQEKTEERINYWGFKKAFYYAPNGTYAATADPESELKQLVKEAHQAGIEVLLQFYFPRSCPRGDILPVLQYYRIYYHVDGFSLLGEELPLIALAEDPLLSDCKLICEDFPFGSLQGASPHLFTAKREYGMLVRQFVKGDEAVLKPVMDALLKSANGHGLVNFLADYSGFRLADVFSYERKHNEGNGEENRDGCDLNYSWNCGAEGPTGKKSIQKLRLRLMKNALVILFLSRGIPYLFMGDEAGSSQEGNNNPYCQDNEISWVNWRSKKLRDELTAFTKQLISLRKEFGCLTKTPNIMGQDGRKTGFPELSFHGEEAFKPDFMSYSRHAAMLLNGAYYGSGSIYAAFNMHWMPHRFAIPKLTGEKLTICIDTFGENSCKVEEEEGRLFLVVPERTICIMRGEPEESVTVKKKVQA